VRVVAASVVPALLYSAESHGAADPTDTLQLAMTGGMIWDDNLFRIPEGNSSAFGISPANKADRITRVGVIIKYDKTVSRQRFVANVNVDENTFEHNTYLKHTAANANAKWLWAIGSQWDGELNYNHARRLSGFANLTLSSVPANTKNLVDLNDFSFTGGFRPHPRWRIRGGIDYQEYTNTSPSLLQNDINIKTTSLGVDYRTPSGNTLGMQQTYAEGFLPNRQVISSVLIDNQYTETSTALTWYWNLTGHSYFDGKLGYTSRKHEQFATRDFSGLTYQLHYLWLQTEKFQLDGKFQLDADAWRGLGTAESYTSSYVLAEGLRLTPLWTVTPKFALRGMLSRESRSYLGDPGVIVSGTPVRADTYHTYQLAATYTPWRNAEIMAMLERGHRESSQLTFQYDYHMAVVNLKLNF
jgi:exopolysaccharide biosynthesis operon protein EpsL